MLSCQHIGDNVIRTQISLDEKEYALAKKEAKTLGCSYADIRFTRSTSSGVNANGGNPVPGGPDDLAGGFGGFGGGGRGGGRGGGGGGRGGGGGGGRDRGDRY